MVKGKILSAVAIVSGFLVLVNPVLAHVVVTPRTVGIAATQVFTLTAPTEKDGGTVTSLKLILPAGLNFVTPIIQTGWTVAVTTAPLPKGMKAPVADDGDVADSIPTEIDWTGGQILSGQEAQFMFSAQVPPNKGELDWKAYQGYSDGTTVSWDLGPKDPQPKDSSGNLDFDAQGPYSKTMVINDLTNTQNIPASNQSASDNNSSVALQLAILATILSIISLWMVNKKTASNKASK